MAQSGHDLHTSPPAPCSLVHDSTEWTAAMTMAEYRVWRRVHSHPCWRRLSRVVNMLLWGVHTLSWLPSNSSRYEACVPVVPFTPRNLRSALARSKLRRSIIKSCIHKHALLPTVVNWAGLVSRHTTQCTTNYWLILHWHHVSCALSLLCTLCAVHCQLCIMCSCTACSVHYILCAPRALCSQRLLKTSILEAWSTLWELFVSKKCITLTLSADKSALIYQKNYGCSCTFHETIRHNIRGTYPLSTSIPTDIFNVNIVFFRPSFLCVFYSGVTNSTAHLLGLVLATVL